MKRAIWAVCTAAVAAAAFFSLYSGAPRRASLLFVNGRVHTLDARNSVAEAVAVNRGRIAAVGSTDDLRRLYEADSVIDLKGRTLLPGFIDGHGHVGGFGKMLRSLFLYEIAAPQEIVRMVGESASERPAGEYIHGRGWDQNLWPAKEFPAASMLDAAAPGHPVILVRVDGHAIWVNSAAMRRAGITRATPDPDGGKILRDQSGNPTGVFLDNARDLVERAVPAPTHEEIRADILSALRQCASAGLTAVQDMGVSTDEIAVYRELADRGELPVRIYAAISAPGPAWNAWRGRAPVIGAGGDMLTIRGVKLYVDGALGSRGAALLEAYSDDPGNRGITIASEGFLDSTIREAYAGGYQVSIHAIGDRANHIALNAIEKVQSSFPAADRRPRIEHAQVIAPDDIPRFRTLGVLASMEPVHATSDMYWAEGRLGPARVKGAYAWRSLLASGARIVGGSDFPNDQMNPVYGFYAACTRSDRNGYPQEGWHREQKMSREEAARSFTQWAAYGAFEESSRGTIEPGKWADLTLLSEDIMTAAPDKILSARAEMTIVAGRIVYARADSARAE